jgi:hypothetical protein
MLDELNSEIKTVNTSMRMAMVGADDTQQVSIVVPFANCIH